MEKQTLPNSTLILVLGILSLIGCCCYGVLGLILGIIAIVLANSARKTYFENPELYLGYENVKIGRILAIIGVCLSVLTLVYVVYVFTTVGGIEGIEEFQREFMEEFTRAYEEEAAG